jgi:hypothetical protein
MRCVRKLCVTVASSLLAGLVAVAACPDASARDWQVFKIRGFNYPPSDKLPVYDPTDLSRSDSVAPDRLDGDGDKRVWAAEVRGLLCVRTQHIDGRKEICINNNHVTTDECRVAGGAGKVAETASTMAGTAGLATDC